MTADYFRVLLFIYRSVQILSNGMRQKDRENVKVGKNLLILSHSQLLDNQDHFHGI